MAQAKKTAKAEETEQQPVELTDEAVVEKLNGIGIAYQPGVGERELAVLVYNRFDVKQSTKNTGGETAKDVITRLMGEVVEVREDGVKVGHKYATIAAKTVEHFAARGVAVNTTDRSVACYKHYAKNESHGVRGEVAEAILAIGARV